MNIWTGVNRRLDDAVARSKIELLNEIAKQKINSETNQSELLHELQTYHAQQQRQHLEHMEEHQNHLTMLEDNRALMKSLFMDQEKERRHLSHKLHDEMGHWIAAIQAEAEALSDGTNLASATRAGAQAISSSVCQMHEVLHALLRQLRPVMLDELGLGDSLRELQSQWIACNANTECELLLRGDIEELGDDIKIAVYRIIQEALNNVRSHAHATQVNVRLSREYGELGDTLVLSIEDNGRGYDSEQKPGGMGLLEMRERAIALGGVLSLHSLVGRGMHVLAKLPIKPQQEIHGNSLQ